MKMLVTGANGQLGKGILSFFSGRCDICACDRQHLDVADRKQCRTLIAKEKPDVIIHAAAMTDVEACENAPEKAHRINAEGTGNVAAAAEAAGAALVYISTDYVFDGRKGEPYVESDRPNPCNAYGKSKRWGERLAAEACTRLYIVRTACLYSASGRNFVTRMLALLAKKPSVPVVSDLYGNPTSVTEVCRFLHALLPAGRYGIYHCVNEGGCSRYEWARAIAEAAGYEKERIVPVSSTRLKTAMRPPYTVLENARMRREGFAPPKRWDEALRECMLALRRDAD